jgi:hypothetical protein
LLVLNIVVGSFVVADYGQSQDEHLRLRYADKSLSAYSGAERRLSDEKGAFYVMLALVGSRAVNHLRPEWLAIDAWHFMHFLTFLMGVFFLYRICLRFVNQWAAFAAALLFNTQPLLWGHAFINPKDIPFMTFFLASVDMGLEMAQSISLPSPGVEAYTIGSYLTAVRDVVKKDWTQASQRKKLLLGGLSLLSFLLLVLLKFADAPIKAWIADLIRLAYASGPSGLLGRFFFQIARNAQLTPVDLYVNKAISLYPYLIYLSAAIFLFVIGVAALSLYPMSFRWLWRQSFEPFIRQVWVHLRNLRVLAAGVFLGLVTAIRVAGPLSGALVGGYLLLRKGRRAIPVLAAYFGVGLLVTYLAWPALWKAPLQQYTKSVSKALDFPWEGKVMFAGASYEVTELPRHYLPTVLSLQFTETAMLMFLVGVVVSIRWCQRKRVEWERVALIAVWLVAPVLTIVILHPVIYDNFRHFLFITPPIFIFSAIGFQWLFERLRKPILWLGLVILLILPNLYWMTALHPYQYVYYNSLVGNVQGAFRRYEMDYWATSYREAIEFINEIAPPNSRVIVLGTSQLVSSFARPDLKIDEYRKLDDPKSVAPAYAILTSRHNKDLELYPDADRLYSVERSGVILAVVKYIGRSAPP